MNGRLLGCEISITFDTVRFATKHSLIPALRRNELFPPNFHGCDVLPGNGDYSCLGDIHDVTCG